MGCGVGLGFKVFTRNFFNKFFKNKNKLWSTSRKWPGYLSWFYWTWWWWIWWWWMMGDELEWSPQAPPPPPTPHPSSSSTKIHQFLLWSGFTSAHDDLFFGLYVCVFVLFMSVVPIQFRNLNSNKYLFLLSQLSLSFVLGRGGGKGGSHLYILSIS